MPPALYQYTSSSPSPSSDAVRISFTTLPDLLAIQATQDSGNSRNRTVASHLRTTISLHGHLAATQVGVLLHAKRTVMPGLVGHWFYFSFLPTLRCSVCLATWPHASCETYPPFKRICDIYPQTVWRSGRPHESLKLPLVITVSLSRITFHKDLRWRSITRRNYEVNDSIRFDSSTGCLYRVREVNTM